MSGLSNRAFAKIAGVSEGAVRKARADRIAGAILPDGKIDQTKALAMWGRNTDPAKQRAKVSAADRSIPDAPAASAGPATKADGNMNVARAMLTIEKARREKIKRQKDEGSAIDRAPTVALTQTLARDYRDGLMSFPDLHYAQMSVSSSSTPRPCRSTSTQCMRSCPSTFGSTWKR